MLEKNGRREEMEERRPEFMCTEEWFDSQVCQCGFDTQGIIIKEKKLENEE